MMGTDPKNPGLQAAAESAATPTPSGTVSSNLGHLAGILTPSAACFDLIRSFEGYAKALPNGDCQAYPDPATGADPWTIGYGSTGPDIKRGLIWTREQAEQRLEADVTRFAAGVAHLLEGGAATSQNEFDALVSFAYNLGLGNLQSSTLIHKHRRGDKAGAAGEFLKWTRAAGKQMPGLVRRRTAESRLYQGIVG